MMGGATCLVAGASSTAQDGGVHFLSEFSIMASAFTLSLVLNFGSQNYVTDCYDELHPLMDAAPVGNEPRHHPPCPALLDCVLEHALPDLARICQGPRVV